MTIYQFDGYEYSLDDIYNLSQQDCDKLCEEDDLNVMKFPLQDNYSLEYALNSNQFDVDNSIYRVF